MQEIIAPFSGERDAGDHRLYVGGGSINFAFGEALKQQQGLQFGYSSKEYAVLHESLVAASRADRGALVHAR